MINTYLVLLIGGGVLHGSMKHDSIATAREEASQWARKTQDNDAYIFRIYSADAPTIDLVDEEYGSVGP